MATTLYLHAATASLTGTLPTAEQSTLTAGDNFEADQATNRTMTTTIGAAQTSLANASIATTSITNYYVARWVSPKLNQTSISANTWTYDFAKKASSTSANFPVSSTNKAVYVNAYVWRTSTGAKVGTIKDGTTNATYSEGAASTELSEHGTFAGSAVANCNPQDDVIIFEMWFKITQGVATSYTQTIYFDGTTENRTTGTTVSNYAAFVETPDTIAFSTPPYLGNLAESTTLSDSISRSLIFNKGLTETLILSSSIISQYTPGSQSYERGIPESITNSGEIDRKISSNKIINENILHDGDVEKGTKRYLKRSIGGIRLI